MPTETFDVVVIGAGSTGENVADRVVQGGLSAVIVESELVGGECSYWACMPSKALLRPVEALRAARHVRGVAIPNSTLDSAAVFARRDAFTSHWKDDSQVSWLNSAGITLRRGHGRLVGPRRVALADGNELEARYAVVICSGSSAVIPPIPGLAEVKPWTAREATSASRAPARLGIIGGGVVGCEMATAWQALGSQVTILARGDQLLERSEPFAGDLVKKSLIASGVEVHLAVETTAASRGDDGIHLELDDGSTLLVDEVLVSVGRRPNTDDLALGVIGLQPGSQLDSDETGLVAGVEGDWLYAVGDVTGWARLTHTGKYHARSCGDAIVARTQGTLDDQPWSKHRATALRSAVPQVTFTDPQVASVGLTAAEATDAGIDVKVVDYNVGHVAGAALFEDHYVGSARMVVDEARQVIVGVTLVGPEVGELLHAATVAIVGEVPLDRLWHAVPSYPTVSEVWLRLLEGYGL